MGKPQAGQLTQELSDSMALETFFLDDINPCFKFPLLRIVAVIAENDT